MREKCGKGYRVVCCFVFNGETLHLKHVGNREKNTGSGKDHRGLGALGTAGLVNRLRVVDNGLDGGRRGSNR